MMLKTRARSCKRMLDNEDKRELIDAFLQKIWSLARVACAASWVQVANRNETDTRLALHRKGWLTT